MVCMKMLREALAWSLTAAIAVAGVTTVVLYKALERVDED